ncbi:HAMP domain-containing histidine kinase [Aquimarina sp. D1M17]|uniref:sensor histidine kinase n=1 Tax=Aquimarina acroporae TaxID=2937283 RepID=UPI0020BDFFDD|nr:HAMP domain-containing sensor histidine kinase [Aquimarina acroporae]MCK8522305.1 HAMP domain-containing histidine kinase [Aquimarina acroporae]
MQKNRYKNILYFITAVIAITLMIQVYWNFKNYQTGKQQLINEVQISLDNAIDQYYEELAKNQTIRFASRTKDIKFVPGSSVFKEFFTQIDTSDTPIDIRLLTKKNKDSFLAYSEFIKTSDSTNTQIHVLNRDSLQIRINRTPFEQLTSKVIVSINQNQLNLEKIDSLLHQELTRKNVAIRYGIKFKECTTHFQCLNEERHHHIHDSITSRIKTLNTSLINTSSLSTISKSSYLPPGSQIELFFSNTTLTILKKNLLGIVLSFLLVGAVIGCLLFLLNIINQQKQLAELKNDLISNITHEFKTPIATISAALEGIQSFNANNDPEKTQKYIEMSSHQLNRLNTMVEKILETATLDGEELQLKKEKIDVVQILKTSLEKCMTTIPDKKNITLETSIQNIYKELDLFHFENAINNILDNAIKYGGDNIQISLHQNKAEISIEIKDDGTSLTKTHKEKIFDKFYRVPKGNTHDIKGFGIGLFYTKTIIEKHGGTIALILDNSSTNFKVNLPND